jgi:apolipoprotein N-acyltransferase
VVGVYGLSLLMVVWAAMAVLSLRRRSLVPFVAANVVVAAFCGITFAYRGLYLYKSAGTTIAGAQLESPTVSDLRASLTLLEEEQRSADIVVFPEYCLDLTGAGSVKLDLLKDFARQRKRWVVVGAKLPAPNGGYYSGVIALAPGGEQVFRQEKSVPVPLMNDGLPAPERRLLETPYGKIGVAICYDMDFTFVSDDLVRQGAEFLLYPTMDCAEWGAKQRTQHAAIAPLRAIENCRWVMRVASSGVSCIVDPTGRVITRQGVDAPGGLIAGVVWMHSEQTLYARGGWLIPWVCFWATALLLPAAVVTDLCARFRQTVKPAELPATTAPAFANLHNPGEPLPEPATFVPASGDRTHVDR